jgi:hypothetical protein
MGFFLFPILTSFNMVEISLFLESLGIDCTHPVRLAVISLGVKKGFYYKMFLPYLSSHYRQKV